MCCSDNHKIFIGESVLLVTTVPDDLFDIGDMTKNGSYLTGTALQPGVAPVRSVLESVRGIGGKIIPIEPVLSAQAELEIFPKLAIKPSEVILPWHPRISSSK